MSAPREPRRRAPAPGDGADPEDTESPGAAAGPDADAAPGEEHAGLPPGWSWARLAAAAVAVLVLALALTWLADDGPEPATEAGVERHDDPAETARELGSWLRERARD